MKLAFREYGEGRPLIILHGLFGQSDNWNTLAKQFAAEGFQVFTVDQRNHGLSLHSDEWTYEAMAQDLFEFIREHNLREPILLGHSMGAKTVLFFEYLHAGMASRIVIADMAARAYGNHHKEVLKALNAVDFSMIRNRKEAEQVLSEYLSDSGTKQFLLKNLYYKDQEHAALDWRFNLKVITRDYENVSVGVPHFTSKVPTLIVRGERSNYVNDADMEDYRRRFESVEFVTIIGAAHWVHAERPKEFFDAVLGFIRS